MVRSALPRSHNGASKITHLLIDADHTIFDFDRCQNESLEYAFKDCNLDFQSTYCDLYTSINKRYWKLFEGGEITREQLKEYRFKQFFSSIGQDTDPVKFHEKYVSYLRYAIHYYDGAKVGLEKLSKKYILSLITNGLAEVQRPRIERSGIGYLFNAIMISGEIGYAKPDKIFFEKTFEALSGPKPNNCMVIGDNLFADIHGGQQSGTITCWFNNQKTLIPDELDHISPDYEVDSWPNLLKLLSTES